MFLTQAEAHKTMELTNKQIELQNRQQEINNNTAVLEIAKQMQQDNLSLRQQVQQQQASSSLAHAPGAADDSTNCSRSGTLLLFFKNNAIQKLAFGIEMMDYVFV